MSTETGEELDSHIQSLIVIAATTLGGIGAGVATNTFAAGPSDQAALVMVGAALAVELVVMQVAGVEVREFSTKDQLYVTFMTFSMWYVTWTILLSTGA
ncbi:MAG: hypothetical protein ABEH88_10930 [Halobacteriales archaeon]